MEPLKTYDYLSRARQRICDWVRPLNPDQYTRQFPIGLGSLARTLTHIMICEEVYVRRIQELPVLPYDQWPIKDEQPPAFAALEAAWIVQARVTRTALAAVQDWTTTLEYTVVDDGRRITLTASRGDILSQLAFHEVHHRAQAMNMLRQLGTAAEDLDFNTLMYGRREVPA